MVRCGMCAREVYVDDETYRFGSDAMNSGLDNPFRCEVCIEEYDDLNYEVESLCALFANGSGSVERADTFVRSTLRGS